MKKYLVIGNPIEHSLSPKLHNHWIKIEKINAIYEKRKLNKNEIKDLIGDIKDQKINGINVNLASRSQSVTTADQVVVSEVLKSLAFGSVLTLEELATTSLSVSKKRENCWWPFGNELPSAINN